MGFCGKCGNQIHTGDSFCSSCGNKVNDSYVAEDAAESIVKIAKKSKTITPQKIIVAIIVCAAGIGAATTFFKSDEEKIEERIEQFEEAYNSGDSEGILECTTPKSKSGANGVEGILSGLTGDYGGYNGMLGDMFGLGVALTNAEIDIKINEIDFEDDDEAIVYCIVKYSDESPLAGTTTATDTMKIEMSKVDNDWYIELF